MDKLLLNKITYTDEGHKILYDYSIGDSIQKFFEKKHPFYVKYLSDVSTIPNSIAVIPFLSNILPIAWFAGFDVEIDEVDEDFFYAQEALKKEFGKRKNLKQSLTGNLIVKQRVKNNLRGNKTAMLFSGGVDAYATYIRIYDKKPDLITLLGADIEISDNKQWEEFTNFIENETLLNENRKEYIETNLRDFYTYQVELLLTDIGWWGKVQHGLALIGSLAPLSYKHGYEAIYIASSYTDNIDIDWGSTPEMDEKITWSDGVKVYHDGYELKRQDKVDLIADFSEKTSTKFRLRVCYSENRTEFNCSACEKCFRTILGLILNGKDPNNFGFKVDGGVYNKFYEVLNIGEASKGVRYFWWELMEKAKATSDFYIFENQEEELEQINFIRQGKIDNLLEYKMSNSNKGIKKLKFIFRNKFPGLIKLYRKLR